MVRMGELPKKEKLSKKDIQEQLDKTKDSKFKTVEELMRVLDVDNNEVVDRQEIAILVREVGEGLRMVVKGVEDVNKVVKNLDQVISIVLLAAVGLVYGKYDITPCKFFALMILSSRFFHQQSLQVFDATLDHIHWPQLCPRRDCPGIPYSLFLCLCEASLR